MKAKLISMMCLVLLLTGCAQTDGESALRNSDTENVQTGNSEPNSASAANPESSSTEIKSENSSTDAEIGSSPTDTSAEDSTPRVFLPDEKTAPITPISSEIPNNVGSDGTPLPGIVSTNEFELDGIEYYEFPASSYFVVDDGEIVQEPYEESVQSETNVAEKLPDAIGKLFSLEYLGALRFEEYLFRYDDYILAVMNAPDSMKHDIFFKDSGYDESQFYAAYFYVPYDD